MMIRFVSLLIILTISLSVQPSNDPLPVTNNIQNMCILPHDKMDHIVYSAFIQKVIGVQLTTATIGILKEVWDQLYGTGFDIWDLAADGVGILWGSAL